MQKRGILAILSIWLAALLFCAGILLGSDVWSFYRWYGILLLLSLGMYPLSSRIFSGFSDRGWFFSRLLGILIPGYVVWVLSVMGILQFTSRRCVVITYIILILCWFFYLKKSGDVTFCPAEILLDEVIFLSLFLAWTHLFGFRPEARGTEKFMDFGFMAAMDRSIRLPALDIWFGQKPVNYYYGGQYFAVYLTNLSYTEVKVGYHLMRALIASVTFLAPLQMVREMVLSRLDRHRIREEEHDKRRGEGEKGVRREDRDLPDGRKKEGEADERSLSQRDRLAAFGFGLLAGGTVSLAGNLHYLVYGLFGRVFRLPGWENYWFPDSTRYIGYNPDRADKCIHEFPAYSTVLGDLHAHYINLIFVLLFLALLYVFVRRREEDFYASRHMMPYRAALKRILVKPDILLLFVLLGLFQFTNYWDYIIYSTVLALVFCMQAVRFREKRRRRAAALFLGCLAVQFTVANLAALPFRLTFVSPVSGLALADHHSLPHQFFILWGLPILVTLLLAGVLIGDCRMISASREGGTGGKLRVFFRETQWTDLFCLLLGCCAVGLVLLPELVYVRDIYGEGYARSNTMFKLTYQAFVLFGIVMAYTLSRLFLGAGQKRERAGLRAAGGLLTLILLLSWGYSLRAGRSWFGEDLTRQGYRGLDATAFLEEVYPEDAPVIRWMEKNIKGQALILEAPGDSYSENCRVSAMTGLPTLEGWYVHEWLWRNDPEELDRIRQDIERIYTSESETEMRDLLYRYRIRYVFVGSCERKLYGDRLQDDLLESMGRLVSGSDGPSYLIEVE